MTKIKYFQFFLLLAFCVFGLCLAGCGQVMHAEKWEKVTSQAWRDSWIIEKKSWSNESSCCM